MKRKEKTEIDKQIDNDLIALLILIGAVVVASGLRTLVDFIMVRGLFG